MKNVHGLTQQQEVYAHGLARGMRQSPAYRVAYPTSRTWKQATVHQEACRLAANPKVSARVEALQAAAAEQAVMDRRRILDEVNRIATFDPRSLYDDDGTIKQPHELDATAAAAVAGVVLAEDGKVASYKLVDKNVATANAMRHLGLFKADNTQLMDPLAELLRSLSGNVFGPAPGADRADLNDGDDADPED